MLGGMRYQVSLTEPPDGHSWSFGGGPIPRVGEEVGIDGRLYRVDRVIYLYLTKKPDEVLVQVNVSRQDVGPARRGGMDPAAVNDAPWLTVREATARARIGQRELLAALADGSLRGHQNKPGGRWRIHRDDVDAWLRGERRALAGVPHSAANGTGSPTT